MNCSVNNTKNRRQGMALVLSALLCLVLVPMVGIAIDGAVAYMMRAQVSRAVDAAVLAGARSLNVGLNISSQTASATAVAQKYFDANLPAGRWGSSNVSRSVSVGQDDKTRYRWVTVTASADVPLTFMSMLGFSQHISVLRGQPSVATSTSYWCWTTRVPCSEGMR